MKRWIHAASDAQINSVKKYVRTLIYTLWIRDPDDPSKRFLYFDDPTMFKNRVITEYLETSPEQSYPSWVYSRRNEFFKDYVYRELEDSKYSPEVIEIGKDYFDNLTPTDYNRNLMLKADVKHYISKGLTPTEYFAL